MSEKDVRDHLSELSDEQLEHVAGGAAMLLPAVQKLTGRNLYAAALGSAVGSFDSFFDIDVECRG